jgi:RIO kinase 1
VAAKVYRTLDVRGFADDSAYREGRLWRNNRYARAIQNKSRRGREFAFSAWVAAEYATLSRLHEAGADVPEPLKQTERVILMEYVEDGDGPAPPLSGVRLDTAEACRVFDVLVRNIELALACDCVHGDLSAFNVLYADGMVKIIDFPQAVDPRVNHSALSLLERDIDRLCGYFDRMGVSRDGAAIARGLWSRFLRAEL